MNSPAVDVANLIQAAALGTGGASTGWSISVSTQPARPDTTITVYDTGGPGPDTDDMDLHRQTIQVRVRSRSYAEAYAKLEAIAVLITAMASQVIGSATYVGFNPTSDVLSLGRDDNDRQELTQNFTAIRQRTLSLNI